MREFFYKYLILTRRGLGIMFEYRVSMLIWTLSASFPLVMLAVWLSIGQGGPIGGYTPGDFIVYYLLVFYMRQMTSVWVAWELDYDIRQGAMSSKLLHPIHPIHEYISNNLADKVMRFVVFTPIVILVALFVPRVNLVMTPLSLAFFIIAVIGAWLMRYLLQFTLGLFSFWFSQALVLTDVAWLLILLFGGSVAPLDLLPEPLRTIAYYLPFQFMVNFPVQILLGRLTTSDILYGLGGMAFWSALFYIAFRVVWARGIRQFSAFGA